MKKINTVKTDNDPLPLSEIKQRISLKTYQWLQEADEEEAKWNAEVQKEKAVSGAALFSFGDDGDDDDDDDEFQIERVCEWCSSSTVPDGIGEFNIWKDAKMNVNVNDDEHEHEYDHDHQHQHHEGDQFQLEEGSLRIKYILSDSGGGHGDDLWPASRHISNLLANRDKCHELLRPLFLLSATKQNQNKNKQDYHPDQHQHQHQNEHQSQHAHPLLGLNFVELGAGAGLPSWTAMRRGAKVVCTDQSIADRIRCIAESAERNVREMRKDSDVAVDAGDDHDHDQTLCFAEMVQACPYNWGSPIDALVEGQGRLNNDDDDNLFDVVVSADCIYMPQFHSVLLDSINMLMSKTGVALLPFALHGNAKDDDVWSIVDLAKDKGFHVDTLEPQQLTPQAANMETKRALVHLLRLTRTRF